MSVYLFHTHESNDTSILIEIRKYQNLVGKYQIVAEMIPDVF